MLRSAPAAGGWCVFAPPPCGAPHRRRAPRGRSAACGGSNAQQRKGEVAATHTTGAMTSCGREVASRLGLVMWCAALVHGFPPHRGAGGGGVVRRGAAVLDNHTHTDTAMAGSTTGDGQSGGAAAFAAAGDAACEEEHVAADLAVAQLLALVDAAHVDAAAVPRVTAADINAARHHVSAAGLRLRICLATRGLLPAAQEPPLTAAHYPVRFWLLVLSNLAFIPVIAVAWHVGAVPEASLFAVAFAASTTYHMCDEQADLCFLAYDAHQFFDFFCAFFAVAATLAYVARLRPQGKQIVLVQSALWLGLGATVDRTDVRMWMAPVLACVCVVLYQWGGHCVRANDGVLAWGAARHVYATPWFRWVYLVAGGACALGGMLCVALWEDTDYAAAHSLWHVLIATSPALLFLAPATPQLGTPLEYDLFQSHAAI